MLLLFSHPSNFISEYIASSYFLPCLFLLLALLRDNEERERRRGWQSMEEREGEKENVIHARVPDERWTSRSTWMCNEEETREGDREWREVMRIKRGRKRNSRFGIDISSSCCFLPFPEKSFRRSETWLLEHNIWKGSQMLKKGNCSEPRRTESEWGCEERRSCKIRISRDEERREMNPDETRRQMNTNPNKNRP